MVALSDDITKKFLDFLNKPENIELKKWTTKFNQPEKGFMFTEDPQMEIICKAVDPESAFDNATVLYLRACQRIFTNE